MLIRKYNPFTRVVVVADEISGQLLMDFETRYHWVINYWLSEHISLLQLELVTLWFISCRSIRTIFIKSC